MQSRGIEMQLRLKELSRNIHWIWLCKDTGVLNREAGGQHSANTLNTLPYFFLDVCVCVAMCEWNARKRPGICAHGGPGAGVTGGFEPPWWLMILCAGN